MIPLERQRAILQLLEKRGTSSIAALTAELGVSHMTVRRDVRRLEEMGRIVSVSGGVSLPVRLALDHAHTVKEGLRQAEKAAIARAAVEHVAAGDVVYLDAGTTTLAVARLLAHRDGLTFVTNDLAIATYLSDRSANPLYLAGGRVDQANLSTEGPTAAGIVAGFNIDVAFMSTPAFDLNGISVPSEPKLAVKRAIRDSSARVILVSDSTKYGKVAALRAVRLTDLDAVISDRGLAPTAEARMRQLDVALTLVEPDAGASSDDARRGDVTTQRKEV